MKLGACDPSPSSGVPTTPVPQKAAPTPRYNDITRPRALRVGGDGTEEQTPQPGTTHSRLWDSSGGDQRLAEREPIPKFFRSPSVASLEHPSGADFPSPWQGTIVLPDSDEETINTAQAWIAQILDDAGANGGEIFPDDVIVNGRALCEVANAIAWGAVDVIHEDESDTSNDSNMRSFLVACQKFGVPAGALFDVDDRDPARIGLCLHVLSRVVRDTVPGFSGPFLSQVPDRPSPYGSGGNSSSSADDDTSRGGSTCRVDDNDEHPQRERLLQSTSANNFSGNSLSAALDDGIPDKIGPPRCLPMEHHHRGKTSFSASEGQQQQQQQATTGHARCAPPPHAAPSPFGQTLLWPLGPPPASGAFEPAPDDSPEEDPPAPQRRPLSLPSRLSRTLPVGDTLLSSVPLLSNPVDDTIWNSIFDSQADDANCGDGGRKIDARATWAPPATKRSGIASLEKGGQDALPRPTATSEEALSSWLSNLNLGSFANDLANIGVEVMGDLRYVEEKDLSEIGMHGPQIRKLLQNRP